MSHPRKNNYVLTILRGTAELKDTWMVRALIMARRLKALGVDRTEIDRFLHLSKAEGYQILFGDEPHVHISTDDSNADREDTASGRDGGICNGPEVR